MVVGICYLLAVVIIVVVLATTTWVVPIDAFFYLTLASGILMYVGAVERLASDEHKTVCRTSIFRIWEVFVRVVAVAFALFVIAVLFMVVIVGRPTSETASLVSVGAITAVCGMLIECYFSLRVDGGAGGGIVPLVASAGIAFMVLYGIFDFQISFSGAIFLNVFVALIVTALIIGGLQFISKGSFYIHFLVSFQLVVSAACLFTSGGWVYWSRTGLNDDAVLMAMAVGLAMGRVLWHMALNENCIVPINSRRAASRAGEKVVPVNTTGTFEGEDSLSEYDTDDELIEEELG